MIKRKTFVVVQLAKLHGFSFLYLCPKSERYIICNAQLFISFNMMQGSIDDKNINSIPYGHCTNIASV
jgi:hypothetical protein